MSLKRVPDPEDGGLHTARKRVRVERPGSPVPSCQSLKSGWSMDRPWNFKGEFTGDQRLRSESPPPPVSVSVGRREETSDESLLDSALHCEISAPVPSQVFPCAIFRVLFCCALVLSPRCQVSQCFPSV
ncbi:hypothetical protein GJAV_G00215120 [Gymnothorax javanicus]|nr:hypothetical protein GJAV_G00215120 [Gymnothorax javanicus]